MVAKFSLHFFPFPDRQIFMKKDMKKKYLSCINSFFENPRNTVTKTFLLLISKDKLFISVHLVK